MTWDLISLWVFNTQVQNYRDSIINNVVKKQFISLAVDEFISKEIEVTTWASRIHKLPDNIS